LSDLSIPLQPSSTPHRLLTRLGPTGLVLWTIAISAVIRLVLAAGLGYGYGEAYYLATARHLALSYFDQPPVSLWVAWATIQITGVGSTLVDRLPFIAMFAVTSWLMYRLGARLFGAWAGAWSAVLLNLSVVFTTSIASWVQPDGPLFLFMLAATIPIVELALGTPRRPLLLWALAGAGFGLALLSKYHAALTLAGLLIFVATTPGHRKWFFHRGLILAGVIAALIFSPVLIWNWQNDWASFAFQGDRIVESQGLRFDWLARSILGQAFLIGLLIWPPMMVAMFNAFGRGPRDARSWFLCCLAIIPIILFTLAALWAPLGWHFHWQAPGYLYLLPLLGKAVTERLERGDVLTRRWLGVSVVALLLFVGAIGAQAVTGWTHWVMPASLRAQPYYLTNPTRELLSFDELRGALVARGLIPRERLFAVTPRWTMAGKVDDAIGSDMPVVCFSDDPRNIAFGWNDRDFLGWDALLISTSDADDDLPAAYGSYFRDIAFLTDVDIHLGGAVALTVHVYYAQDYKQAYPLPLPPRRK
jgi:hypothetical protein